MIFSERPPEALSQYTGFLMNWVALRSRRHFAQRLEERFGLHPKEFGALRVIAAEPGHTQQALCSAAGVDPSSMVATLDELERRGLAERRPHPSDRRKRAVYITSEGERVAAGAQAIAAEAGAELLGALTDAERAELNRLLRKLTGLDGEPSRARSDEALGASAKDAGSGAVRQQEPPPGRPRARPGAGGSADASFHL
jgi:DNA-binding MarR family transcriptional regulator